VNAYVKYGYGKTWPDGHQYSKCRERTNNPNWILADFPKLQFKTTIDELMSQVLLLHVTDAHDDLVRGEKHTPLGEMKFIFKLAIESKGDTPIDSGGISFKSPLVRDGKITRQTLEGILSFDNIPHFAQMIAVNVQRVPVHTEEGILDGKSRFPWLVQPELPTFLTGSKDGGQKLTMDDNDVSGTTSTKPPAMVEPSSASGGKRASGPKPAATRARAKSTSAPPPILGALARAPSNSRLLAVAETNDLISFSPSPRKKTAMEARTDPKAAPPQPLDFGADFGSAAASAAKDPETATAPAADPVEEELINSKSYNPFV
jgi:hypothetical protein